MKKIVHVITGLNTGGAEMMLYKLLLKMNRSSFPSYVVSLGGLGTIGPQIESLGVRVYTLNLTSASRILPALFELHRIINQVKPDIVQGWMYHGNLFAAMIRLLMRRKVRLLWNIRYSLYDLARDKFNTRIIIKLCAALSRLPDVTIYNSRVATGQHQRVGYSLSRHRIIPNGFDLQIFHSSAGARDTLRSELHIDADAMVIGHVARFHPMKGHDVLFDAMALLYDRYPNVHYVLAGRGVCPSEDVFRRFLVRFPSTDRIHLLGERKDIPSLTAAFDLAVSSSSWGEGFSNTIGEAMACGIPCVVTDVGDSAWIVGEGGIVVPPSQPRALAAAMEKIILLDCRQRKALGDKGRSRIENNFSIQEITNQYQSLYDNMAAEAAGFQS